MRKIWLMLRALRQLDESDWHDVQIAKYTIFLKPKGFKIQNSTPRISAPNSPPGHLPTLMRGADSTNLMTSGSNRIVGPGTGLSRECLNHDTRHVLSNVRTNVRKYVVTWLEHSRESNRRYPNHPQRSLVLATFCHQLKLLRTGNCHPNLFADSNYTCLFNFSSSNFRDDRMISLIP